jgi:hypothetical protein
MGGVYTAPGLMRVRVNLDLRSVCEHSLQRWRLCPLPPGIATRLLGSSSSHIIGVTMVKADGSVVGACVYGVYMDGRDIRRVNQVATIHRLRCPLRSMQAS